MSALTFPHLSLCCFWRLYSYKVAEIFAGGLVPIFVALLVYLWWLPTTVLCCSLLMWNGMSSLPSLSTTALVLLSIFVCTFLPAHYSVYGVFAII